MNKMDMMSPEKVAEMYGGDKRRIGQAAQMGLIDPTVAVMAGMFIDRMRGAAAKEAAPQASVAQEVMAPATAAPVEAGLAALPVPEDAVPSEYAGGGVVAFARGDLVGKGITEPLEGESYGDYLMRRAKESLRGPFFSEEGTMPRMGLSEAQADALNKSRENQKLFGDILSGKAPVPTRSSDATLMREAAPPGIYADETTRGTARRVAAGGPGRTMEEFGIGATEMAAKRAADEAAKKGGDRATVPAKEEPTEDFLARRKRMLKESGVSEDPYAEDRAALAELKGKMGKERSELDALTMIKAGLGIAGRKSPYALQNLAGAESALESYGKGIRQLKEDEKEYAKIDRDLRKAEDALKRGDVDKALEYEDKAKQRDIQLRGVQAQERAAAKPSSITELFAIQEKAKAGDQAAQEFLKNYLGAAKTGQVDERFLREQWGKMKPLDKMLLERQGIKTFEQWAATQGYPVGGGAGAAGMGTDPLGLRGGR